MFLDNNGAIIIERSQIKAIRDTKISVSNTFNCVEKTFGKLAQGNLNKYIYCYELFKNPKYECKVFLHFKGDFDSRNEPTFNSCIHDIFKKFKTFINTKYPESNFEKKSRWVETRRLRQVEHDELRLICWNFKINFDKLKELIVEFINETDATNELNFKVVDYIDLGVYEIFKYEPTNELRSTPENKEQGCLIQSTFTPKWELTRRFCPVYVKSFTEHTDHNPVHYALQLIDNCTALE